MKKRINITLLSAIWYLFSNVLAKGITVLLTPFFTRVLTTEQYGMYTNYSAWQNILVILFSLEISSTVMRAKFDYDEESFRSYVITMLLFSITLPLLLIALVLLIIGRKLPAVLNMDETLIAALAVVLVFYSVLQIFQAEQRTQLKYKGASVVTICFSLSSVAFPMLFISFMNNHLYAVILGIAVNYAIWGIGLLIYYLVRAGKIRIRLSYVRYALIIALPVVPHLLSNVLMGNSDKLMITDMCGEESAALYGVVYQAALAITLLRNSLNSAWTPWLYEKLGQNSNEKIKTVSDAYIIIFSMMALLVSFFGREIVLILGGEKYLSAVSMLPFIMLGCYYNFLNLFYVNLEFYYKKTYMISVITVTMAALNIVLNYVGIKLIGYEAAAMTTALCNGLIVLLHYFVTRKYRNGEICNNRLILGCSMLGVVMAVAFPVYYQLQPVIRISIFVACAAASYLFVLRKINYREVMEIL